jgi:hypothetical protein
VRWDLSVARVLAELKARRARIDRAIAALERIRDSRNEPIARPKASRHRRYRAASRRAASRRTKPAKPAAIIPFAEPGSTPEVTAGG